MSKLIPQDLTKIDFTNLKFSKEFLREHSASVVAGDQLRYRWERAYFTVEERFASAIAQERNKYEAAIGRGEAPPVKPTIYELNAAYESGDLQAMEKFIKRILAIPTDQLFAGMTPTQELTYLALLSEITCFISGID